MANKKVVKKTSRRKPVPKRKVVNKTQQVKPKVIIASTFEEFCAQEDARKGENYTEGEIQSNDDIRDQIIEELFTSKDELPITSKSSINVSGEKEIVSKLNKILFEHGYNPNNDIERTIVHTFLENLHRVPRE